MSRTAAAASPVALAALALVVWAIPQLINDYFVRVLIVMCINAILVASLSVANGFTGVFSLGHVGFVAIGAYASGILSMPLKAKASYLPNLPDWLAALHLSFLPATVVAGLLCVAVAFVVGAPLMRLRAFRVGGDARLPDHRQHRHHQRLDFTRGARTFTGVPLQTNLAWAAGWLKLTLTCSPASSIRHGPALSGGAGGHDRGAGDRHLGAPHAAFRLHARRLLRRRRRLLYGHYLGSFSPHSFYMAYTFALISMLVIGGMQSLTGAVLGVVVVTLCSEVLRNLERGLDFGAFSVPPLYGASQIVLGILFILVMIFRPTGIMGDREIGFGLFVS